MDYTQLCAQLQGLIGGVPHLTAICTVLLTK